MRSKRIVFYNSLLSLVFSWGISYYLNRPDQEATLLMAAALALLCTVILIPTALGRLEPEKPPLTQGIALTLMLLPLLAVLSHPALSIAPFIVFMYELRTPHYLPWLINTLGNGLVFFVAGYGMIKWSQGTNKTSWKKRLLVTFLLLIFYALTFYACSQISEIR